MEQYLYKLLLYNSGLILATIAGISRYRYIDEMYRPFVMYIFLGFCNELLSLFSSIIFKTTFINNNLFMLGELLLLNLQFKYWSRSNRQRRSYTTASCLFLSLFVITAAYKGLEQNLFFFNAAYCFYLVMCATGKLGWLVSNDPVPFYKNPVFIICCAIIIYFSFRIIIEAFWFYGLHKSSFFRNEVYVILMLINLFVNILYLYALLWIQKKPDYITFYG